MKRLVVLTGTVVMLSSIAGCTAAQVPGSPTSASAINHPHHTTRARTGSSLPYNDPCTLLSPNDLEQLGSSTAPSRDDVPASHGCSFDTPNASIDVGVRPSVGLSEFQANGGEIISARIGSHQTKQVLDRTDSCVIGIGVTNSSRVDVTVTADDKADSCPIALRVARLVEPELPVGGGGS